MKIVRKHVKKNLLNDISNTLAPKSWPKMNFATPVNVNEMKEFARQIFFSSTMIIFCIIPLSNAKQFHGWFNGIFCQRFYI